MENDDKKKSEDEGSGGTPAWMVTFSDLSTLLLTFFVLLLSMSSMDQRKLKSLFTNFTSSCGILYFKEYGEIYRPKEVLIEGIAERLKDALVVNKETKFSDPVSEKEEEILKKIGALLRIEHFNDGLKIIFGHQLIFSSGSAEINEDMKPVLDEVARFMRNTDYQAYIDGHTDNTPIRDSKYKNNEELSMARAVNIMSYLKEKGNIPDADIAIGGYGALHPVATNETPAGRMENRRVEIIFKNRKYF